MFKIGEIIMYTGDSKNVYRVTNVDDYNNKVFLEGVNNNWPGSQSYPANCFHSVTPLPIEELV